MEAHVKQRITGAVVLVVLIVIFVPALLTGPHRPPAAQPSEPGQPALQTFRTDVKSAPGQMPASVEPAPPDSPRANADDAVAPVMAGADSAHSETPAEEAAPPPATKPAPAPTTKSTPAPPTKSAPAPVAKSAQAPAAKATTAPAPAHKPLPVAGNGGAWAVQLGGFSSRPNAQRLVGELKDQGFGAYVSEATSGGHTVFRVRAGPVHDRADADALLKRLKVRGHSGSVVTNP